MTPKPVVEDPDSKATWMGIDVNDLGRAYSPSTTAPNFLETLDAYKCHSDEARSVLGEGEVLRYGPQLRQSFRLYRAAGSSPPLLVFFHGGYWCEGSADMSLFPAPNLVRAGVSYAVIGYTLAPDANLPEISAQCATALAALARLYGTRYPRARIVLSGSSAGAHLAATMMTVDWRDHGFSARPFVSAVLLSGVYDLRPLVSTYINDPLNLDAAMALKCSPLFSSLPAAVPCALFYGEREPQEFSEQSDRLGRRLNAINIPSVVTEVPGRDHFDIVFDLSDANTLVGLEVLAQMEK